MTQAAMTQAALHRVVRKPASVRLAVRRTEAGGVNPLGLLAKVGQVRPAFEPGAHADVILDARLLRHSRDGLF